MHAVVLNRAGRISSVTSPKSLDLSEVVLATEEEISKTYKPYHLFLAENSTGPLKPVYLGPEEITYYTYKD